VLLAELRLELGAAVSAFDSRSSPAEVTGDTTSSIASPSGICCLSAARTAVTISVVHSPRTVVRE
jgi:hypothetical protein